MQQKLSCLVGVLVAHLIAPPSLSAITVLKGSGSPAGPEQATVTFNPETNGWTITLLELYSPGGITEYVIRGNGGEMIEDIFIDVPCLMGPSGDCAPVGSPVYIRVLSDPPLGINSIQNIEQTSTGEIYVLDVQAEQDVGSVNALVIGKIVAGRHVYGPIISTVPNAPIQGVFWVESGEDILGDVTAMGGRIGLVYAHGDLGAPGNPVTIAAKYKINGVASDHDMFANINTRANGGDGAIFVFHAERFFGSLETAELIHDVATGTPGRIEILSEFEGSILIGRSFNHPDQWMQLPTNGFNGDIIFNADSLPGGTWSSPIYFGTPGAPGVLTLTGPNYSQSAAQLGGGSIGLTPFGLHAQSCLPPSGGSVASLPATVVLRHYGPVVINGSNPLAFDRRAAGSSGAFQAVSASNFAVSVSPTDSNSLLVTAAPGMSGFENGFEYRLTATSAVKCDVSNPVAVQWAAPYLVTIDGEASPCPADLDGNNSVGFSDLLILLSEWNASGTPSDLDGSGTVGFSDLLALLAVWGRC